MHFDRNRRNGPRGLGFGSLLKVFEVSCCQFLPDFRETCKVDVVRAVIKPSSAATNEGQYQQILSGQPPHSEVDFPEISSFGGQSVFLGIQKLEALEAWGWSWQIKDCGRKSTLFGHYSIFHLNAAVFNSGVLPSDRILAIDGIGPRIVAVFQTGLQGFLSRRDADTAKENRANKWFHVETIGQDGRFHNKQIAARVSKFTGTLQAMSDILQKVAPIGEARDREILKDAATYVYQERPQGKVQTHVFFPENASSSPRPVVVFFHGGFWDSPTPSQFVPHCLHFASRGAVAVAAETRTAARYGTGPVEAVEDARDLIRWLRNNADTFNIDPQRLAIGGAAGGAFLALLATMPKPKAMPPVDGLDCRPQALVLFSALVNTTHGQAAPHFPNAKSAKRLSPHRLVRRKLPPMILFHGKSDRITPFEEVERFRRRLRFWGNTCDLVDFEREDHSFFNFNVSHRFFELTIEAADRFLVAHGILAPNDSGQEL